MIKFSAKNKKMLAAVFMWFGIAVIVALFVRVFRGGVSSAQGAIKAMGMEMRDLFRLSVILVGIAAFALDNYLGYSGYVMAVALGTLTSGAGVVTTFNTTYLPKQFFYVAATQLTGVKITVQGDGVIFDSDTAGLNHCGVSRIYGQVTNGYLFTISNGLIKGKNVIWEFTNSAAQNPTVFVASDETPAEGTAMYLQLLRQAILANSGQDFTDFATLSLPSLSATDVVNVLYRDGTQQQLNRADIQAALARFQNVVNTPIYTIDNYAGDIKRVNVLAGAAQTAYVQRWAPSMGQAMVSQVVNNT